MAQLTVTSLLPNSSLTVNVAGAVLVGTSSTGDFFFNTGKEVILMACSTSYTTSTVTVSVVGQAIDNFGGLGSLHTLSVTVTASSANGLVALGPFRPTIYNDTLGRVQLTYSGTNLIGGGVTAAVVTMAPQS